MARQNRQRHPIRREPHHHVTPFASIGSQDGLSRHLLSRSKRNRYQTPRPSISPRGSFHNNEELPRLWQRSSSPAPRRLGDTSFQYRDLDLGRREIRLLRILPEATSTIKCELFHTSLYNPCPYIAISYAWGDTDDTRTINLDGVEFPVTESLMLALQRLRSRSLPVIVWADVICINQENTEERNIQVQAMRSIYQQAIEVAIWLGSEADNSDMALELLRELCRHCDSRSKIRGIIASSAWRPSFDALVALFGRGYWERLWVVQEVINSRKATLYCGSGKLEWDTCLAASDVLHRYNTDLIHAFLYGRRSTSPNGRTSAGLLSCGGPRSLRNIGQNGQRPTGLLDTLLCYQEKACTEPRDRVYGLLGILSDQERSHFPVDYCIPTREVFIDVVDHLLTTTGQLDAICASISFPVQQNLHGLPSWCPDWSQRRRILPISNLFPGSSAAGKSEAIFSFSKRRKVLAISAIPLDRITLTGISLNTPICSGSLLMAFFEWRHKLVQFKGYDDVAHRAFCRTISCGQLPGTQPSLLSTYRTFAASLLENNPTLNLDSHLRFYVENFDVLSRGVRKEMLSQYFSASMAGRCFAITSSGLMCLGSGALQVGDIVCVPLGCSTPVILRERGDGYTFVGDVYVDGYMHGKAIEDWQNGTRQVQTFVML